MKKDEILELIRSKEKELYADFKHFEWQYGTEHKHTRFAFGAWGSILNLLETIEANENN